MTRLGYGRKRSSRVILAPHDFAGASAMAETTSTGIESTQQENRLFPPPKDFAAKAHIKSREQYDKLYRESIDNPEKFWGDAAGELHWFSRWNKVLEWNPPYAKWFVGGKTNLSYNCLDRHVEAGRGD